MSVRLASARNPDRHIGWHARGRGLVWPAQMRTANENGDDGRADPAFDPLLTNALRHFATHGLGAVDAALATAAQAHAAGDGPATAHWLAIAAMLDRRRAAAASAALNSA